MAWQKSANNKHAGGRGGGRKEKKENTCFTVYVQREKSYSCDCARERGVKAVFNGPTERETLTRNERLYLLLVFDITYTMFSSIDDASL